MTTPATLAIDTTRDRLQLALVMGDGATATEIRVIAKGHAEVIFDAIAALLARQGLAYANLDRLAVSTGPGSFTGLRIGLSAARGLGLALDIPVIGIPSFLALSLGRSGAGDIVVDAKRGEAYRQSFSAPGVPSGPAELVALEAALARAGRGAPDDPVIDIAAMAGFAARVTRPEDFPPAPSYIRAADAKPQTGFGVARQ
ncbi:tRNA (adenosine(37)-N6)-threonylcarbamoyltransferase complex dimerization subunit type 1 TsaB [Pelagibacterium lacus]|uniref:tRNA (Adenosine(37)-N6)-threonylcarbamoyltransferase complex dimerization subunit type 1 TsaB n=1 Tax=Pelagibacterium lacus TaxID=2282655 RepID=A0A369W4K7_9HYPH|nr:tRNA (adenosine(37)-N6)-threonylcarbamoyltransferase complex dimerization subunit type 1 TsaB [Pelagibacterium lacus]RDE09488.1 tRNA (adenosine(37)-N6)-threonylcarbamoyltransferase complex dimerization subunit type 1 TsaB [Pelagibacterium lacus]